jgi:hypothetical protein
LLENPKTVRARDESKKQRTEKATCPTSFGKGGALRVIPVHLL